MTFSSLDDVINLVIFYSIFTKMTTFEVYFVPEGISTNQIQGYPELANRSRISKMYRIFLIYCSFIKIIAVKFGAI